MFIRMRSKVINKVSTWYNTLLATEFHRGFERWVGTLIKDTPNAYDKMIDSNYINTHIGSWKHRLFDGSHTPHEMWDKVKNTFPNDSRLVELQAYFLSMMKDLQTPAGLPFLTVSKEGYDKTSSYLKNQFGIPANWYYDIQTVNLAEIFGTTLGALAVFFQWNKKDKEIFGEIASSLFISGMLGGNPLVIILSLVTLGRAYSLNKRKEGYNYLSTGLKKGGLTTSIFIGMMYLLSAPILIELITAFIVVLIARKYFKKISFKEIYEWFMMNLKKLKAIAV